MKSIIRNVNKDKRFGLTFGLIFLGVALYQYLISTTISYLLACFGIALILAALIIPSLLYSFRAILEIIGHYLGVINTYLLLTVIYFLLFVPIGLLLKLFGKDNLMLKWDKNASTYWIDRTGRNASSMENQF